MLASFSTPLIVVQGQQARGSNCDVSPDIATHSHEEANTLIPLHVLDSLRTNTMRQIDVHCGDTDGLLAPDRSCCQQPSWSYDKAQPGREAKTRRMLSISLRESRR